MLRTQKETILHYTIPYYTILYYTILYYTILYYTILYYTILYYTILYYTILYYTILYYTILYYTILYYTILYYTILYYTKLYNTPYYYTMTNTQPAIQFDIWFRGLGLIQLLMSCPRGSSLTQEAGQAPKKTKTGLYILGPYIMLYKIFIKFHDVMLSYVIWFCILLYCTIYSSIVCYRPN